MTVQQTITKTCSVSGGDLPEGYKQNIDITFDFSGASDADVQGWAVSHLVIATQRALKKMSTKELDVLSKDGYTVRALDAGKRSVDVTAAFKGSFASMSEDEQKAQLEELMALMKK